MSKSRLCLNCLGSGHGVDSCTSKGRFLVCVARHHTKMHSENLVSSYHSSKVSGAVGSSSTSMNHARINSVQNYTASCDKAVLLSTAYVRLESPEGISVSARALLNSGAEESYISEHLAQMLKSRKQRVQVTVSGVGAAPTVVSNCRVSAVAKSNSEPDFNLKFSALVFKKLSSLLLKNEVSSALWDHLKQVQLADPYFASWMDRLHLQCRCFRASCETRCEAWSAGHSHHSEFSFWMAPYGPCPYRFGK